MNLTRLSSVSCSIIINYYQLLLLIIVIIVMLGTKSPLWGKDETRSKFIANVHCRTLNTFARWRQCQALTLASAGLSCLIFNTVDQMRSGIAEIYGYVGL